jgi:hypothetical protein
MNSLDTLLMVSCFQSLCKNIADWLAENIWLSHCSTFCESLEQQKFHFTAEELEMGKELMIDIS